MNFKSILLSSIMVIFAILTTQAQAPEGINYQAIARDNTGNLVKNKSITIKASIMSGVSGSNKVYEETHSVTTNEYGQFGLVVGKGSSSNNFSSIAWGDAAHHLKVEIDQGAGYVAMGTVQLQSVPYALHSKTAEKVSNLSISTSDISDINSTGAVTGNVLKWNGTAWVPGSDDQGASTITAGTGIDYTSGVVSAKNGDPLWNANKLSGNSVDSKAPASNQILRWDGSKWTPSAETASTKYFQGGGITFSNDTIKANFNSAMWNANKLNGIGVSTAMPSTNQVLQYDGSKWGFATISGAVKRITDWDSSGNNIYYRKGGNVGINTRTPMARLSVFDSLTHSSNGFFLMIDNLMYAGRSTGSRYAAHRSLIYGTGNSGQVIGSMNIATGTYPTAGEAMGTYSWADGDGGYNTGLWAFTGSKAKVESIAVLANARATSTYNVGVFTSANMRNSTSSVNTNYGLFAAADSGTYNYAGYFIGNLTYTGTLAGPSDAKLKYDVNNLTNATDVIKNLRPTSYFYKQDGEAGKLNLPESRQFGFIAQELEEVLPNLVSQQVQMNGHKEEGAVEYKAVNYMGIIPVLTQALKEQQEVIEALQKRIEALENNAK